MDLDRLKRAVQRLTPTGGTTERIVKSVIWVTGQNVIGRLIQLAMLLVLARLIGPREIGLVGIALLALSASRKFTNIGLNAAIVQRKESNVDGYLNTNWLLEIGRGALITVVLFASAPLIASLFDTPRAEPLLQAIGFSPLILGLRNPGVVYFQKNLEFHKQFVYRITGSIGAFIVAVGYALVWPTAWAYVAGFLTADVIRLVVSYVIHDYRPRPQFDREVAGELINYGKWITGSSILYFIYSEGDDAFVGWLLGPIALGWYQYAYRFSNAPATEISQVVSSVMFPAFSEYQDNPERLRSSFLKTVQLVSLVTFPMATGIAVVTPTFVRGFLGSDWTGMITAMQILTLFGLFRSLGKVFGAFWKAIGRPDYITKLSVLRVALLALLIYPATSTLGITGTALLTTGIFVFPMMPIDLYIITRSVGTSYSALLSELVYPLAASAIMGAIVWYVNLVLEIPPIAEFVVLVGLGAVIYGVVTLIFTQQFGWDIDKNVRELMSTL